ncbi:MAG: hypothetical protein PQJ49_01080 [Sphaerochaetaceae bacterium]|nr:hypothetical protein [Sphaerochaetaceae bacterium]
MESIHSRIESTIEKAEMYQRAYNICMGKLQELMQKDMQVICAITSDYAISITPVGIFKDGKEITWEELHEFIDSKRPEYESKS